MKKIVILFFVIAFSVWCYGGDLKKENEELKKQLLKYVNSQSKLKHISDFSINDGYPITRKILFKDSNGSIYLQSSKYSYGSSFYRFDGTEFENISKHCIETYSDTLKNIIAISDSLILFDLKKIYVLKSPSTYKQVSYLKIDYHNKFIDKTGIYISGDTYVKFLSVDSEIVTKTDSIFHCEYNDSKLYTIHENSVRIWNNGENEYSIENLQFHSGNKYYSEIVNETFFLIEYDTLKERVSSISKITNNNICKTDSIYIEIKSISNNEIIGLDENTVKVGSTIYDFSEKLLLHYKDWKYKYFDNTMYSKYEGNHLYQIGSRNGTLMLRVNDLYDANCRCIRICDINVEDSKYFFNSIGDGNIIMITPSGDNGENCTYLFFRDVEKVRKIDYLINSVSGNYDEFMFLTKGQRIRQFKNSQISELEFSKNEKIYDIKLINDIYVICGSKNLYLMTQCEENVYNTTKKARVLSLTSLNQLLLIGNTLYSYKDFDFKNSVGNYTMKNYCRFLGKNEFGEIFFQNNMKFSQGKIIKIFSDESVERCIFYTHSGIWCLDKNNDIVFKSFSGGSQRFSMDRFEGRFMPYSATSRIICFAFVRILDGSYSAEFYLLDRMFGNIHKYPKMVITGEFDSNLHTFIRRDGKESRFYDATTSCEIDLADSLFHNHKINLKMNDMCKVVSKVDEDRFILSSSTLSNDTQYFMVNTSSNFIKYFDYLSLKTNSSIKNSFISNQKELYIVFHGIIAKFVDQYESFLIYDQSDGVPEGINDAEIDSLGNIWLATDTGLYKFKEPEYTANLKHHRLKINGEEKDFSELNQLASDQNSLEFSFKAITMKFPKHIRYSTYLEGLNEDWTDYNQERKVSYDKLNPGEYTFNFRVRLKNGRVMEGDPISFKILPPWYRTWWFYIICIITVSYTLYMIYKLRVRALKENEKRLETKVRNRTFELVREKNKILESLDYAANIQRSILPVESDLLSFFNSYFIIYQPRDKVGGDFVWYHRLGEHKALLAVADCTGHGVPGALLTIASNGILNSVVKEQGIIDPAEILRTADIRMKDVLHSAEFSHYNGMDLGLLLIDKQSRTIEFSSANTTLFISENQTVSMYKGQKKGIGDSKVLEFTKQQIALPDSAKLYISTDGLFDMAIEESERKVRFKTSGLTNQIEAMKGIPMEKQAETLKNIIADATAKHPQRDDITVIGVEL